MSTQKFLLRNKSTGEIAPLDSCWVFSYSSDIHDLIPVGMVPLSEVREMLNELLLSAERTPHDEDATSYYLTEALSNLDDLAKRYSDGGAE